ncbi:MAG: peptidylprolyl isomerase [Bacteroidota bacterium]|nr:peptidylprolyl isomerase [Bacteroidota bacterium]
MEKKKIQHTGIMNKMRDKMPLIIIILIVAFLATIVFEWGMNYVGMGGGTEAFGKINSEEISYQDYEKIVQQQLDQTRQQNQGAEIDDATITQVREQVWNSLVSQTISKQAIEKYGITVSEKEIQDWVYNRPETLPEPIKKNFMDSTGVFNAGFYQQALVMKTKEASQFWNQVENFLRETLLSERLQAVITEGAIVSEGDVLEKYKDDNIVANFSFVLLDLNTITDSAQFAVSDDELKKYFEDHKIDYKQNESVKLKYVMFNDQATAEDSTIMLKQLELLKKDLNAASVEDSSLIKLVAENSSIAWNPEFQKAGSFAGSVSSFLFKAKPGDVSDVLIGDAGYQIVKLLDVKETPDLFVNVSHILVKIESDTAAAKKEAEDVFQRVKNGEDISQLAFDLSDDPSAKQNRGDLGWLAKGATVKEFEDASFNANVGDIVGPVKTSFGFHIIKVLGKEKKEFKVAQISKAVTPSSRSKQLVKKKSEDFYSDLKNGQNIDSLAKQNNLQVEVSPEINKDGQVPGTNNKNVLKFAFDTKVNSYTEPIKVQGGYSIYEVMEKKPEGYQNFDSIKVTMIKPKVINEKKYKILLGIANDLEGKIQNNDVLTLKEVAGQYTYETADSFKVSKPNPVIGQDYALSSAVMKMKPGEISKPIKGVKGYYIVKLNTIVEFDEQDYILKAPEIKKTLLMAKRQAIVSEWLSKMQSEAEIVDNRDKYF